LSLAFGALLGGVLQLLMQLPYLKRMGVNISPAFHWRHPALRRILRLMGPAAFGAAVYQLTVFINTVLASLLSSGSVSYLYYADRLIEFPLGIFAIAVGTAVLPSLSRQAADGDRDGLKATMGHAMRLTLFINLPAMVGVIVLAQPLVELLFMRGRFDQASAEATAGAVAAYGVGLWAFAGIRAVVAVYYALKDTRTPVVVAALVLILNVALSLALMPWLKHVGLALATSLSGAANLLGLLWLLRRRVGLLGLRRVAVSSAKALAASLVMAAACAALAYGPSWGPTGSWQILYLRPLAAVALGLVVYLGLAKILRMSELDDLMSMFKRG
jgi:putative peptidoglycan lipid II flippase